MSREVWAMAMFGIGYALFYYATNVLIDAYMWKGSTPMNPVPLGVCIGLEI